MKSPADALRATFTREKVVVSAAIIFLAALIPFIYRDLYGLGVLITMFSIVILNISWNFQLGFGGIWNFGQLAVFAVGGYGTGIAILKLGFPPLLAIPVGGIAGAVLSLIIAIPTLRLFGIYTALLTFSAAEVVRLLIMNDNTGLTGGALGLPGVPGLFSSQSPMGAARGYYWFGLGLVVITVVVSAIAVRSPFGLALRTAKESLAYGSARGIDVKRYRVLAFIASGFFAGIAGALYTLYNGSMAPAVMGLTPLSIYVAMLVIGGLGSITGPIVGTAIVTVIQQALLEQPGAQLTVLGILLLLMVIFIPRGISNEFARHWKDRVMAWVDADEADDLNHPALE